jgi:TonB family protein
MPRFPTALVLAVIAAVATAEDELLLLEPADVTKLWTPVQEVLHLRESEPFRFDQGCAAVSFVIESDGRTSNVKVLRSVPHRSVGRLAREAVRRTRYEPSARNEARTPVFTYITVTFRPPTRQGSAAAGEQRILDAPTPSLDHDVLNELCRVESIRFRPTQR